VVRSSSRIGGTSSCGWLKKSRQKWTSISSVLRPTAKVSLRRVSVYHLGRFVVIGLALQIIMRMRKPPNSRKFNKLQRGSAICLRQNALKIGRQAAIRIGRRCAPSWCIFRFNNLENQLVEPCGTFSYNFDYIDGLGHGGGALAR
jgi:hypothetical protein